MAARQTDPQFKFRIPPELKARLESSAEENSRTLTAEIIHRLEGSFPMRGSVAQGEMTLMDMIESIERQAREMRELMPPGVDLDFSIKAKGRKIPPKKP